MSTSKLVPLQDRVLVKPIEADERSSGGVIVPSNIKEKPQEGIVIAVGPGKKDEPMSVAVGDHVFYGKYGATEIKYDNEVLFIMRESDILAVIK